MLKLVKGNGGDPINYMYINVLDRLNMYDESDSPSQSSKTELAKIEITPDYLTTGILEDMELII